MQRRMREASSGGGSVLMDQMEATRLAALQAAEADGPVKGVLPMHGNQKTYNIEELTVTSILQSSYFRDLT